MVEIRIRQFEGTSFEELYIDGIPVEMGDGAAELVEYECKIHGKAHFLLGANQGGYDGMAVCLKCCQEIVAFLEKQP